MMVHEALVLTDIQNDFLPGGALPVPDGEAVVPVANRLIESFSLIITAQDWHPPGHVSFAETHGRPMGEVIEVDGLEQILWPVHCVQGSRGAALAPGLNRDRIAKAVYKGADVNIDSYSAFFDNGHLAQTDLHTFLQSRSVRRVYLCGLATDYCVKASALDARRLGYETYMVADACRGIESQPGDVDRAIEEMREAGVAIVTSDEVLASPRASS
jgi:nicotinamidase/pyrazinamidase